MTNRHRGEVSLTLGAEVFPLRLTLQALAEIEAAFDVTDLQALGQKLGSGRIGARDLTTLLGAAMRGGGARLDDAAVARLVDASAIAPAITALGTLFALTFGAGEAPEAGRGPVMDPPVPQQP